MRCPADHGVDTPELPYHYLYSILKSTLIRCTLWIFIPDRMSLDMRLYSDAVWLLLTLEGWIRAECHGT